MAAITYFDGEWHDGSPPVMGPMTQSFMHGSTVVDNTLLTRSGARTGLITTEGYRDSLQIARSFIPGGRGGWVIYNKSENLAPLECTVEVPERIGAKGDEVRPLDEDKAREAVQEDPLSVQVRSDWAEPGETLTPGCSIGISRKLMPVCGLPSVLVRTRQKIQSPYWPSVVQVFCPLTT